MKSVIENTQRPSAKKLYDFLYAVKKEVESTTENKLLDERYKEVKSQWLSILDEWDKEFEEVTKGKSLKYFDEERRLKNRLRAFVDNHLMFAKESLVPFDNNLAESGIRHIKSKLKVIGGFRNIYYANGYAHFQSICDTARKNNLNIIETIMNVIKGNTKIFNFLKE